MLWLTVGLLLIIDARAIADVLRLMEVMEIG